MKLLAIKYREAQLYAHAAHNLTSGQSFFSDHEFFGELYSTYESAYDSIIERMIGLGFKVSPLEFSRIAAVNANDRTIKSPEDMFKNIKALEEDIDDTIAMYLDDEESTTPGVRNLLEGLADESEIRQYKINQRLS